VEDIFEEAFVLLRLQAKQHRNWLPRRMPCEEDSQVEGTLLPQESRTLHSDQPAIGGSYNNAPATILSKHPLKLLNYFFIAHVWTQNFRDDYRSVFMLIVL
jgi:hypothetical protein